MTRVPVRIAGTRTWVDHAALMAAGARADAERARVPYEEFCRQRATCAGLRNCPLEPTCAD